MCMHETYTISKILSMLSDKVYLLPVDTFDVIDKIILWCYLKDHSDYLMNAIIHQA